LRIIKIVKLFAKDFVGNEIITIFAATKSKQLLTKGYGFMFM
jgi:hypothetical protein